MIYTVGNVKNYLEAHEKAVASGDYVRKIGYRPKGDLQIPEGYAGGIVFQHYHDAVDYLTKTNTTGTWGIFGVDCGWEDNTRVGDEPQMYDERHLIHDAPIIIDASPTTDVWMHCLCEPVAGIVVLGEIRHPCIWDNGDKCWRFFVDGGFLGSPKADDVLILETIDVNIFNKADRPCFIDDPLTFLDSEPNVYLGNPTPIIFKWNEYYLVYVVGQTNHFIVVQADRVQWSTEP